jgi:hypothetical protein
MAENDTKAQAATPAEKGEPPKKIRYHFLKSNAYRAIHADGVFGGVTPRLTIAATFFNERHPLPDQTVHEIKEDGTIGEEIRGERISRDGLVRELEANIIMDVGFAKVLVKWLNDKIEFIENAIKEAKEEAAKADKEHSNGINGK